MNSYGSQEKQQTKMLVKNKPYIQAVPIMWVSNKSQRVATSSYGSELQAVFQAFDAGAVLRSLVSELLFGRDEKSIQVDVRNDNLSLVNSINAIGAITQEKRLIAMLESLREMLNEREIKSIGFIPGATNLADGLTKSTTGCDLQSLLMENRCVMVTQEEKKVKMWKTAADKQYLFMDTEEKERRRQVTEKAKQKFQE